MNFQPFGRLLGIWAHPDDEAYLVAGLMGRVTDAGGRVTSVSATLGELGFPDDDPRDIADRRALRRAELTAALGVVGVDEPRLLGLPDSGVADHDGGRLAAEIGRILDETRPDVVVTFGPDGITGHPDHIAVGRATTLAWRQRRIGRLLYATHTSEFIQRHARLHSDLGMYMGERPTGTAETAVALAVKLAGTELDRKIVALRAHASQTRPLIEVMGASLYRAWVSAETFRDAHDRDFADDEPFRGGDQESSSLLHDTSNWSPRPADRLPA